MLAAALACSAVSATTIATQSPTYRTLPIASAGCCGSTIFEPSLLVISHPVGMPPTSSMSLPVKIAWTPGAASAALVSIPPMFACATGDRRMYPYSCPGRLMSSV